MDITKIRNKITVKRENEKWVWLKGENGWFLEAAYLKNKRLFSEYSPPTVTWLEKNTPVKKEIKFNKVERKEEQLIFYAVSDEYNAKLEWDFQKETPKVTLAFKAKKELDIDLLEGVKFTYHPKHLTYSFVGGVRYTKGNKFDVVNRIYNFTYPFATYYKMKIPPRDIDGNWYRSAIYTKMPIAIFNSRKYYFGLVYHPVEVSNKGKEVVHSIRFDGGGLRGDNIVSLNYCAHSILKKQNIWLGRHPPPAPLKIILEPSEEVYTTIHLLYGMGKWHKGVDTFFKLNPLPEPTIEKTDPRKVAERTKTAFSRAWDSHIKTFLQLPFKRHPEFLFDDLLFSLTSFEAERLANFYDYYIYSGDKQYLRWVKDLRKTLLSRSIIGIHDGYKIWHNGIVFNGVRAEGYTYLWTGYAGYPGGQATIVFRLLEYYQKKREHERINDLRVLNNALDGLEWIIDTQKENGAWRSALKIFREYPARRVDYSKQESIGGSAECIRALLKAYEVTGERKYRAVAEKGLKWLNDKEEAVMGYNYLRDAGIFEEEGISAIVAANANIDAYLLLNNERYLKYAQIWAKYLLTWHFMWRTKKLNIKYGFDPLSWSITPRVSPYETAMVLSVYSRLYKITRNNFWKKLFIHVYNKVIEYQEEDGGLSENFFLNYLNGVSEIPVEQTFATNELLKASLEYMRLEGDINFKVDADKIQLLESNKYLQTIKKEKDSVKIILKNDDKTESPPITLKSDYIAERSVFIDSQKEIISREKNKVFGIKVPPNSKVTIEIKEQQKTAPGVIMEGGEEYTAVYYDKNKLIEITYTGKNPVLTIRGIHTKYIHAIYDLTTEDKIVKKVSDKGITRLKLTPKKNKITIVLSDKKDTSRWYNEKYKYRIPLQLYPAEITGKETPILIPGKAITSKSPLKIKKSEIIFVKDKKEIPFEIIGEPGYLQAQDKVILYIKPDSPVINIDAYIGAVMERKTEPEIKVVDKNGAAEVYIKEGDTWSNPLSINLKNTPFMVIHPNKTQEKSEVKVDFSFWDTYSTKAKTTNTFKRTLRNYYFRLMLGAGNLKDLLYGVGEREKIKELHIQPLDKIKDKKIIFNTSNEYSTNCINFKYALETEFHRIIVNGYLVKLADKLHVIFNPLKINVMREDIKNCKQPLVPFFTGQFKVEEIEKKQSINLKKDDTSISWYIYDQNKTTGKNIDRFITADNTVGVDVALKTNWVHAGEYYQFSALTIEPSENNVDIEDYKKLANNFSNTQYESGELQAYDEKILEAEIKAAIKPVKKINVGMIYPGATHGIYHYVSNLRRHLSKEDIIIKGFYFPEEVKAEPIEKEDIELPPKIKIGEFYFVLPDKEKTISILDETYKKEKINILHLNWPSTTWDSYAIEFAKKKKIPIVINLHYALSLRDDFYGILSRLMYNISKRYLKYADKIIVTSKAQESFVKELGYRNVTHIPTGVDINYFKPIKRKPTKIKTILYIGRISPEKNLESVIRAFKKCEFQDARLVIIGKGPLLNRLKTRYTSENIIFTGYIPESEKLKYLQNSDLFVSATKMELMSISVLEAMASGIPVVTSRIEAFEEFVTRDVGRLIDLGIDFEDKLKAVFEELIHNDKKRRAMGKRAREKIVRLCSWEKIAHRFREIYESLT
ncbi:MAG: glycosyltransferase [Candidatus Odinarchaeia archaeon]